MSAHLRRRADTDTVCSGGGAGDKVLHTLEDLQSRIHADPNDKVDAPPEQDPAETSSLTLTWNEIPAWQKDNEYILTGYRRYACGVRY